MTIKEDKSKGIYVAGLTAFSLSSDEEVLDLINYGYDTKKTRETRLNEYSSRSHTIFTMEIV